MPSEARGPEDDFWATIDRTRPTEPDPAAHAEALVEALVAQGVESTLAFGRSFDEASAALLRWDLWGAAYYVLRGCGDDSFEYLRAWIIGRGEDSWRRASSDPEAWLLDLLAGASDPEAKAAELGLEDGEPLLYAAGIAHERLTGSWLPPRAAHLPSEPAGDEWAEEDLPARYLRLTASLPSGWWEREEAAGAEVEPGAGLPPAIADAAVGIAAFTEGDHDRALALLVPLFEDPEAWQQVVESGLDTDAAYMVGIGRLMAGDPDGASEALKRALDPFDPRPEIRRALAQVELARGELGAAADLLDRGPGAHRMDRALAVTLAFRRGDHGAARAAAREILADDPSPDEHPWNVAGVLVQVALILVELRDEHHAPEAADRIDSLIEGAPPTLPLHAHAALVRAGALRIEGQAAAAETLLDSRLDGLEGSDRGQAMLELARIAAAEGLPRLATERYELASEAFERAGERWMADFVRTELGRG